MPEVTRSILDVLAEQGRICPWLAQRQSFDLLTLLAPLDSYCQNAYLSHTVARLS